MTSAGPQIRISAPAFGEHVGEFVGGSESGPFIADGETVVLVVGDGVRDQVATLTPELAQQIAGSLIKYSLAAAKQRRLNKRSMEDSKNG